MSTKLFISGILALGVGFASSTVFSATCDTSNLTFGVYDQATNTLTQAPADTCYGPTPGNDSASSLIASGTWELAAKYDWPNPSTPGTIKTAWGEILFDLTPDSATAGITGLFTLNWEYLGGWDSDKIPVELDINFVTKASQGFVEYVFNDQILLADANNEGYGKGSFEIDFRCTGGQTPPCTNPDDPADISHLSAYVGNFRQPENNGGGPPTSIPEPSLSALLGFGLLGFGATQIRRKRRI